MSNADRLREELVRVRRGRVVSDRLWQYLLDEGRVQDAEDEATTLRERAEYLHDKVQAMETAVRPGEGDAVELRTPGDVTTRARIDALSAIYAAWAAQDAKWFRTRQLMRLDDPAAVKAYYRSSGPHPGCALLDEDGATEWITAKLQALVPGGDVNQHVRDLLQRHQPGGPDPVVHLDLLVDGLPRQQTVPRLGVLGELAQLSQKLSDHYRWHPAWATQFVLTGITPTVLTHTASAQIRYGPSGAAGTRVTLTVDPALTPQQVAELYGQIRTAMQPEPPHRAQALRSYRLAEHVGPHLRHHPDMPQHGKRRGRPRRSDPPGGLVYYTSPVGCTWQDLRRSWNERYPDVGDDGKTWRYDSQSNFTRDAQDAYLRLLDPQWSRVGEKRRRHR